MSASSKQVMIFYLKWVIFKQVTVSVLVAKQKSMKKKFKRGKNGRKIGIRRAASSGKNKKERQWSEKDMDKAFDLWEANENLKPEQRKSKRQISIETGIPYTHCVRGCLEEEEEDAGGRLLEGNASQRCYQPVSASR